VYQSNQSINQSINQSALFFKVALATNSCFKDHRGEEQLQGGSDGISAFLIVA